MGAAVVHRRGREVADVALSHRDRTIFYAEPKPARAPVATTRRRESARAFDEGGEGRFGPAAANRQLQASAV